MHAWWISVFVVALAAASAPQPAPPVFSGESGWKALDGSTKAYAGEIGESGLIAEQGIAYSRTGVLRQDLRAGPAFARFGFTAGTPVYAIREKNLGLGWCIPGHYEGSRSGSWRKHSRERCFFWQDGRLVFSESYDTKSPYASALLTGIYYVDGELQVVERPIPTQISFRLLATLARGRSNQAEVIFWFDDNVTRTPIFSLRLPKEETGAFNLSIWGGQLRLEPVPGGRYKVGIVRPVKDDIAPAILAGQRYLV